MFGILDRAVSRVRGTSEVPAGVAIASSLTLEGIGLRVGDATILDGIDLSLPAGSLTCLLGPSGSGKSSILRVAAGLERPTTGRVLRDGVELSSAGGIVPPERRGIGLVFQDYALFANMTLLENVAYGVRRMEAGARRAHAMHMLGRVGLAERANDRPHQLSGGEQQRIALARALAPKPGVLLLDEPFSGLDTRLREEVRERTLAILRETRATAVFVTHDPVEALRIADRVALLDRGRIVQQGEAKAVFNRPNSLFTASFFSELNRFDAVIRSGRALTPLGPVPTNGGREGQAAVACVRISAVSLRAPGASAPAGAVEARVVATRFLGEEELLELRIGGEVEADGAIVHAKVPTGSLPFHVRSGQVPVRVFASLDGAFAFPA